MSETSTVPLLFAVVSGAQIVVTELLRVWKPLSWVSTKVFESGVKAHSVGMISDFFVGNPGVTPTQAAQDEFERRRAATLNIANLGFAASSILVGIVASILALLGTVVIMYNSPGHLAWLVVTIVAVVAEGFLLVRLYHLAAAGSLTDSGTIHRAYWQELEKFNTPAPYAAIVVVVNILVVVLSVVIP